MHRDDGILLGSGGRREGNEEKPEKRFMRARSATLAGLLVALSTAVGWADAPAPVPNVSGVSSSSSSASNSGSGSGSGAGLVGASTRPASFTDESAALPTDPGDHKLRFRTKVGNKTVQMAVLLHLPPGYRGKEVGATASPAPMILFMHGGGECGSDCAAIYTNGPMTMLRKADRDPRFAASFPFVLLAPQCPPRGQRWDQEPMISAVVNLLNDFIPRANVDPDRVYLTGLSMGGNGSWRLAYAAPDKFAAVAPMSAVSFKPNELAAKLWHTSIWSVVGADDSDLFVGGTHQMNNALADSAAELRFTYLQGNGHDAWWPVYSNPQFYEWLLAQRRGGSTAGTLPSAAANAPADPPLASAPAPSTQPVATLRPGSAVPQTPGHYRLTFDTMVGPQPYQMDYLLYVPKDYHQEGEPYPAMFFLHEEHAIGPDMNGLCPHGPDLELARPGSTLADSFPFVVISPRLPVKCDWNTPGMDRALLALLDHVSSALNLDRTRISVSGINDGAVEAMSLASAAPDRFAAIAPVMNDGPLPLDDSQLKTLSALPGWAELRPSQAGSVDRIKSLISAGQLPWRLSMITSPSDAALPVDTSIYADRDFLGWVAQQRRPSGNARSASLDLH